MSSAKNVTMISPPWWGHLFPLTSLGVEMTKKGYRVSIIAVPQMGKSIPPEITHIPIDIQSVVDANIPGEQNAIELFQNLLAEQSLLDIPMTYEDFLVEQAKLTCNWRSQTGKPYGDILYGEYLVAAMKHLEQDTPDCVIADFIMVSFEFLWLAQFCKTRFIPLIALNSFATPVIYPAGLSVKGAMQMQPFIEKLKEHQLLTVYPKVMKALNGKMKAGGFPNMKIKFGLRHSELGYAACDVVFPTVPNNFLDPRNGEVVPLREKWHCIGPLIGKGNTRTLKEEAFELHEWIEASSIPVVYVSFGTLAGLDQDMVHNFLGGLVPASHRDNPEKATWRVLWSLKEQFHHLVPKEMMALKGLLRISTYVPQVQVLNSERVKVFLTHHGQNSTTEAFCSGTPMVGVPMFADQYNWARVSVNRGAGVMVTKRSQAHHIQAAVSKVLTDPSYTECAQKVMREMKDAKPPVDTVSELVTARIASEKKRKNQKRFGLSCYSSPSVKD